MIHMHTGIYRAHWYVYLINIELVTVTSNISIECSILVRLHHQRSKLNTEKHDRTLLI